MLTKEAKKRPYARDLLNHKLIKTKLIDFNLFNFKNEQIKMNTLMDTIIAPVNLKKLKDRLPKKK